MDRKQALIGMSGGVDSSVAAWLTREEGISCIGTHMRLWDGAPEDSEDARAVARKLGIPFQVLSFQREFEEAVIRKFVSVYESGRTPSPCIDCNRCLKFGCMLQKALELGCGCVVSGHYARIRRDEATGRYLLCKALDHKKDQSYFLACLNQAQLSRIRFPLGELTKDQVRSIAEAQGFVNARKRDSQDICFVPDGDYPAFLARYTGKAYPQGDFLDQRGRVVGTHRGAVAYTLGQRRGLGVALGVPAYVTGKDMEANTVTLGPNEALFSQALRGEDWNWYPFEALTAPMAVTARIRHSQTEQEAMVYPEGDGLARVEFKVPQRAVTPGQAVVLYQGDTVIGGGTIREGF